MKTSLKKGMLLSGKVQFNSILHYLTTKNMKITKETQKTLTLPLRVLRGNQI